MSVDLVARFRAALEEESDEIEIDVVGTAHGGTIVELTCESFPDDEDFETSALDYRHERDWEACKGQVEFDGLHVCLEGKRGSMPEMPARYVLRCWLGETPAPSDVLSEMDASWQDRIAGQLEREIYQLRHRFEKLDPTARRRMIATGGMWTDAMGAMNALTARSLA